MACQKASTTPNLIGHGRRMVRRPPPDQSRIPLIIFLVAMLSFVVASVKAQGTIHGSGGKRKDAPIQLRGNLVKFDSEGQTMMVSWSLLYPVTGDSSLYSKGEKSNVRKWNLYRDAMAVPDSRIPNMTNIPFIKSYDLYCVDDLTLPPISTLGQHKFDSIDTEIEFSQYKGDDILSQPLFAYPFDVWTGSIVLTLTDQVAAEQADFPNCFALGIHGISIRGHILNWQVSSNTVNTCEDPDPDAGCELHVNFIIRRSCLVKVTALMIFIAGWIISIVIALRTYLTIVTRKQRPSPDIIAISLGSLFAFPGLRYMLPGTPSFGTLLDLIGILPNVIIILFCSIFIVAKNPS
ncbi:hypothetical protein FRB91_002937 [Serendipita sp. 411]|nr:hypothetical protein FRC16_010649 [Serendipita sp. 398]KAG8843995.1 hypothetical protein FRB91_002937 [Serendipita sp. 411]